MIRKKRGIMTLFWSLFPGAGEMYMGFFKQGASIMSVFFILIFMPSWLDLGPLMFALPVLWFYSFFHVHNMASMSDEDFYSQEDKYIFEGEITYLRGNVSEEKGRKILAVILIVIGVSALWNIFVNFIYNALSPFMGVSFIGDFLYTILRKIPQFALAVGLVFAGLYLIRGKKNELYRKEIEDYDEKKYNRNDYNSYYEDVSGNTSGGQDANEKDASVKQDGGWDHL